MATDGGVGSYVIVMRAVPVRPTRSVAVIVMVFTPGASCGLAVHVDQSGGPLAGPLVWGTAASVDQVTLKRPTSSEAIPARVAGVVAVANVRPVVGVMMFTTGAAGS